jgi:SARP family transcriptional regulator, regulator of embCAB operon
VRTERELTRREPYRESGFRVLMEALASEGNAADALRVSDELRTRLREDLSVAPSPHTQELFRQLLA